MVMYNIEVTLPAKAFGSHGDVDGDWRKARVTLGDDTFEALVTEVSVSNQCDEVRVSLVCVGAPVTIA